ncbi:cytochrome P450 [Apiospora arundinis]
MSKTRETNFRLPEEWEAQEILEEEVVGEKTYYLISWKPTLVPETEVSTTLLQTWRDEMDNLVAPNRDSVLESHVVLQRLVLCSSEDSDTSWCCELKVNLLALRRRPLGFEASLSFSSFLSGSVSRHFWSRDSAMLCELPSFLRRRGVGFAIEHGAEASTFTCLVGGDCDGVFHLLTAFGEITLLVGDMVLEGTRLGAKKFNDGKFLSSLLNLYNAVLDVMMGCDFGVC